MLGIVDRLLGGALGFFTGAFFAAAILIIFVKYFGIVDVIQESKAAGMLIDAFPVVLALLPKEFDAIRSFFQG
jgi:uncharacterized membrane protein required for colicin V production